MTMIDNDCDDVSDFEFFSKILILIFKKIRNENGEVRR